MMALWSEYPLYKLYFHSLRRLIFPGKPTPILRQYLIPKPKNPQCLHNLPSVPEIVESGLAFHGQEWLQPHTGYLQHQLKAVLKGLGLETVQHRSHIQV